MTTWVHRNDRDVVEATGPDARSFLQSLVSQDLDSLAAGEGAASLLLQPQGKLVAPFRVLMVDDERFLLDTDAGAGQVLLDGLTRFMIRVTAQLALHRQAALSLRGAEVDEIVATTGLATPSAEAHAHMVDSAGVRTVRAPWDGTPGIDVFADAGIDAVEARLVAAGAVAIDDDTFETERIQHGVLVFGRDIDDTTIAQEAELETDAVSFTKGCFVGQELVCRIDSRGHVNRFVRLLEFADEQPAPAAGSEVRVGDKVVGTITSTAPNAPVALATVRREVEPGDTVEVADRPATVHPRRPT